MRPNDDLLNDYLAERDESTRADQDLHAHLEREAEEKLEAERMVAWDRGILPPAPRAVTLADLDAVFLPRLDEDRSKDKDA
jgi:hypothetical protein